MRACITGLAQYITREWRARSRKDLKIMNEVRRPLKSSVGCALRRVGDASAVGYIAHERVTLASWLATKISSTQLHSATSA